MWLAGGASVHRCRFIHMTVPIHPYDRADSSVSPCRFICKSAPIHLYIREGTIVDEPGQACRWMGIYAPGAVDICFVLSLPKGDYILR